MANFGNYGNNPSGIAGSVGQNALARAISAYSDQEYTDAVRIAGTALVGSDARISGSDEDYFGSIRWTRTLGGIVYQPNAAGSTPVSSGTSTSINYGNESTDEGFTTDVSHDSSQYIKTLRTMGAQQYNVTQVLTAAPNAIEKVSRDFGVTRARDADLALIAMLKGVTHAELNARRALGTQTASTRSTTDQAGQDAAYGQGYRDGAQLNNGAGFYVDLNGPLNATTARPTGTPANATTLGTAARKLIDTSSVGGSAALALWQAASAAFADLEPEFFYLVISPETYQDIRSANLLDNQDRITDGNIGVDTLLQGKFRLLVTRSLSTGFDFTGTGATNALHTDSEKTSYLMLPGALYQSDVVVPNPVAFDQDESVGRGTGNRELWYRWANIYHPQGYTWNGLTNAFATNATYEADSAWVRKEDVGNMGILPIFHA